MLKKIKTHWPIFSILTAVIIAFYPSIFQHKIPLNGNNLVSFFSPWIYQKWDGYPTGVPAKPGILDQLRIYYPYMHLTQQSYRLGQIPLWNPYNFAGNPHMAEWQSGVFYPLHILLPFLPLPFYWTFYQMTGFFLAAFFTYLYLRNLKLNKLASLFGGLTYSFSTFMFTWNAEVVPTPHSILWLPAMLLLIDKYFNKPKKLYWFLLIGSGVASVLSGYWQTTFYVLSVVFVYIFAKFFLLKKDNQKNPAKKQLFLLLATFPIIAGLTAFHLLPTAELYARSSRPIINLRSDLQEFIKNYLLKLHNLVTLLAPDFFGHPSTRNNFSFSNGTYYEWSLFVGTLQIIILPFLKLKKSIHLKKIAIFFALIAVLAASLSFDLPHSRWVYDIHLPVLSTGIANRILFIPAFAISILAAIALHSWVKAKAHERQKISTKTIILGFIVFASLWFFLLKIAPNIETVAVRFPKNWYSIALRNTIIPTAVFLAGSVLIFFGARKKKLVYTAAAFIVIGATLQNLYQFHKFTPFTETRFAYPIHSTIGFLQENSGIDRYLGYNGVYMNYNFATQLNLFTIEGYDSLNDIRRTQFFHSGLNKGILTANMPRSADVTLDRNFDNQKILRLMSLSGIKYLVDHSEFPDVNNKESLKTLPRDKQKLVFQDGDWKIYQYLDALPRAFLAGEYLLEPNDQKAVDLIFSNDINLRQQVILSKIPQGINPQIDETSTVKVISYTPNKITFQTNSSQDQLLFLSDTYYPGWHATVDDQKSTILAANYAFRAIPVPKGNHTVVMYYLPKSFTNGLLIALVTLMATLALAKLNEK